MQGRSLRSNQRERGERDVWLVEDIVEFARVAIVKTVLVIGEDERAAGLPDERPQSASPGVFTPSPVQPSYHKRIGLDELGVDLFGQP